jgi:mono/diheme cytochrome c family protein
MMGKFIAGIVFAVVAVILAVLIYARGGHMAVNADATPSRIEGWAANSALDAAIEHQAPQVANPVPKTDANLIDGMKLYAMNCAVCHGGLDRKRNVMGGAFYPPVPQILVEALDDPEWHIFFAIKHGVRLTGMPAWGKVMSDGDLWKIVAFVKTINQLPPAVEQQRRLALGGSD